MDEQVVLRGEPGAGRSLGCVALGWSFPLVSGHILVLGLTLRTELAGSLTLEESQIGLREERVG